MQDNDIEKMLEDLLKKQEIALRKEYEDREKKLIEQHEQLSKEWASFFEVKTETIAQGVAEHIGKEVVNVYTMKFGQDSEATQVAKDFSYVEQSQIAVQLMRDDGQLMTADEITAKFSTTWDEFNQMGGLTTEQAQAAVFDPFANEQPVVAPVLTQEVKDIMTAIDYQVQNYSTTDNFPIATDTPTASQEQFAEPTPTVKTPEQVAGSIKSMRATTEAATGSDDTGAPIQDTAALREAAKAKFREQPHFDLNKPTKAQDEDLQTSSSITPEMLAATQDSSIFMQSADQKATEQKKVQNTVRLVENYKTISPLDERLSFENLKKEMSTEKHNVLGKSEVLVNYFDKTRHFDFGGKTAEEFRAVAVEKKDYKSWLNTFQPGLERMKEEQASEMKQMPFDATAEKTKEMDLKHKTEVAFYEASAKLEMSKAEKLFPHEFFNDPAKRAAVVAPPSKSENRELHDTFRDYAAQRLGERWKTEFEKETPIQAKKRILDAKLSQTKPPQEVRSRAQVMDKVRTLKLTV